MESDGLRHGIGFLVVENEEEAQIAVAVEDEVVVLEKAHTSECLLERGER